MTKNGNSLSTASTIARSLRSYAHSERARVSMSFFKTGPGEYGEGDKFIGVSVPDIRKVAAQATGLSDQEMSRLLKSAWHEERLAGLIILVERYRRAEGSAAAQAVYKFYCRHLACVNNWDLVDSTAAQIVGAHFMERPRAQLYKWARSRKMWERRIAIIATHAFIRNEEFDDTLRLAELYLEDEHDLMHKATGWMLREVGKRDKKTLVAFLNRHAPRMPRTMLRYAIEKFSESERQRYLKMRRA